MMKTWPGALVLGLLIPASVPAMQAGSIDGVTFAAKPDKLLVPLREVSEALDMALAAQDGRLYLSDRKLAETGPALPDGTRLIPVRALEHWGVEVEWDASEERALLSADGKEVYVRRGPKRVVIDKSAQELRAVQGSRIIMRAPVSTGRQGHRTPNGSFKAGPYKARMHRSSLYDDAPMPWSVQITGDIFVHGYSSVPEVPVSHGCIRLPIDGENPARFFYQWVDVGTPVNIEGRWSG